MPTRVTFTYQDIEDPAAVARLCADAALAHAADRGEPEMAVGDLEDHLRLLYGILTPEQRRAAFPQMLETLEVGFLDINAIFDYQDPNAKLPYFSSVAGDADDEDETLDDAAPAA